MDTTSRKAFSLQRCQVLYGVRLSYSYIHMSYITEGSLRVRASHRQSNPVFFQRSWTVGRNSGEDSKGRLCHTSLDRRLRSCIARRTGSFIHPNTRSTCRVKQSIDQQPSRTLLDNHYDVPPGRSLYVHHRAVQRPPLKMLRKNGTQTMVSPSYLYVT